MAANDLITRTRAYQALQGVSSVDTLIDTLVTAASDAIHKYCGRNLYDQTYDQLYDGDVPELILREYPVQSVTWIRDCYRPVLDVIQTDPSTNQRATVQVTSTGITLIRVASGTVTTDTTVVFATYATLQDVVTAIAALGDGWSALVRGSGAGDYGLWPSQDLYVAPFEGDGLGGQGPFDCRGIYASLKMHVRDRQDFQTLANGVILNDCAWWEGGRNHYRVKYVAGYTTIPEGLQQACAEWVAHLYYRSLHDPNQAASTDSGDAQSYFEPGNPPPSIQRLLAPYRRRGV